MSAGVAPLPGAVAPDALPVAAVPVVAAASLDNGHCLQEVRAEVDSCTLVA